MTDKKPRVEEFYDAVAADYAEQYRRDLLVTGAEYPSNYFRLQILLNAFLSKGLKRVIEVGVGEGTPLATLASAGIEVWGFDIAEKMVEASKARLKEIDRDPDHIFWGDIQDPVTYVHCLREGAFDGLMAMGVMPHVENDDQVIRNMATLVREDGSVFIEFRNKLFSLFTFNRYTYEFIMDDLLGDVDPAVREVVSAAIKPRLAMDVPPAREKVEGTDAAGYDAILSKFHNPLEVPELFTRNGFTDLKFHWYHYHPAPPMLEKENPEAFRRAGIRLEHEPSGWRGMFLCSAFVVEAVKVADNPAHNQS